MATGNHDDLAEQRRQLLRELADIGDLREGSLRAQYRKCGKPNCTLRGRGRAGTRPILVVDLVGQGYGKIPRSHHSRRCRRRNAGSDRRVPAASRTGARAGRGQRPDMRCTAGGGQAGHAGKKGGLHSAIAEEVEAEVERLIGEGVLDDFQAVETEARRVALRLMGQAVARALNADHCDEQGPICPASAAPRRAWPGAVPRPSLPCWAP